MIAIIICVFSGVAAIELFRQLPVILLYRVGASALSVLLGIALGTTIFHSGDGIFAQNAFGSAAGLVIVGAFWRQLLAGMSHGFAAAAHEAARRVGRLFGDVVVYTLAAVIALCVLWAVASTPGGNEIAAQLIVYGLIIWAGIGYLRRGRRRRQGQQQQQRH